MQKITGVSTMASNYDEDTTNGDAPTTADGTDMTFRARKKKDSWRSPPSLYEPIADAVSGIDLDPTAGPGAENLVLPDDAEPHPELEPTDIASRNVGPSEDGLSIDWRCDDAYVNPMFSEIGDWLAKAIGEWRVGNADRVFFVSPANTGTKSWWHKWIASYASATFFTGPRQNYIDPETNEISSGVSFNTAVSVFGSPPQDLIDYWRREGDLMVRPWNAGWPPEDL